VASLLEIGTGFHGELSGRENIFLNGAILGMKRQEIRNKFDEIVDFAEVEQFLDTPVKKYSSGMYLRLAFAIAAHLDPEILLIDEVLAVGDFKFQQKCLGKMEDIAKNEGRTVIFVSHSMGIIGQLCQQSIFLHKGRLIDAGETRKVIDHYLSYGNTRQIFTQVAAGKNREMFISRVELRNNKVEPSDSFSFDENINVWVDVKVNTYIPSMKIAFMLQNSKGEYLTTIVEELGDIVKEKIGGEMHCKLILDTQVIAPNTYAFCIAIFVTVDIIYDWVEMVCPFKVLDSGTKMSAYEGINFGSYFFVGHQFSKGK
jgi:lipopolysaccharide transport system ATP-binding protein